MPPRHPAYSQLNNATSETRLLSLLPDNGDRNCLVQCRLRIVSLDAPPAYEGLSYVWGDSAERKVILVDGCKMEVTVNLEAALRRLRRDIKEL